MGEITIKVNIAGRDYPLTVEQSEETIIRQAEQQIEESIQAFRQNYAVRDKSDLLAMAALQIAAGKLAAQPPTTVEKIIERVEVPIAVDLSPELQPLEKLLDDYLT